MTRLERMLDSLRIDKGMNKADFVKDVLDMSYQTYQKLITCPTDCYVSNISKVAKVLGISNMEVIRYGTMEDDR